MDMHVGPPFGFDNSNRPPTFSGNLLASVEVCGFTPIDEPLVAPQFPFCRSAALRWDGCERVFAAMGDAAKCGVTMVMVAMA
jgi:hypothetical protein